MRYANQSIKQIMTERGEEILRRFGDQKTEVRYGLYTRFTESDIPNIPNAPNKDNESNIHTDTGGVIVDEETVTDRERNAILLALDNMKAVDGHDGWRLKHAYPTIIRITGKETQQATTIRLSEAQGPTSDMLILLAEAGSERYIRIVDEQTAVYAARTIIVIADESANITVTHHQNVQYANRIISACAIAYRNVHITWTDIGITEGFARMHTNIMLQEPYAKTDIRSVVFASNKSIRDMHQTVEHLASHTASTMTARTVLKDHAKVAYRGLARMVSNIDNLDSKQSEATLMLSGTAQIHAQPDLEIETNAVTAAHSATIGGIPEDAKFALMSRGIPENETEHIIVQGFLGTILNEEKDPETYARLMENISTINPKTP